MIKSNYHRKESNFGTYMIIICSIIFIISFINKQIYLSKLIPDDFEQKSSLTVQYFDQEMTNKPFTSFKKFSPNFLKTKVFKEEMTVSKWNPKNMTALLKNQTNPLNNKCQKCGTEYQNPSSNSSRRDLIISFCSDMSVFKLRFISSLRSSRCQATIVLFTSNPVNDVMPALNKITDNCGVIVISLDDFTDPYSNNKEISFHILFYEFLKEFQSEFDRVVILNPASIIAQSDPFTTYFTYSTVGITTSGYNNLITNEQWQPIRSIDPNFDSEFYDSRGPYLSSAILYGSVDGILMFYGILFSHSDFENSKFDEEITLSAYINYFYHRGLFEKQGLILFVSIPGNFICSIENSDDLRIVTKTHYASPFDLKRKIFFTLNFYREKHILYTAGRGMNPPSIIAISDNDPFHAIQFVGCSNIFYKSRMNLRHKKK